MARKNIFNVPYYYTTAKGKTYLLTPGQDGISEELVTFLYEDDERTRLSDRYFQEAISGAFRLAEELYNADPDSYGASPIDCIPDWTFSPEQMLFGEKPSSEKLDSLRACSEAHPRTAASLLGSFTGQAPRGYRKGRRCRG